MASISPQKDEEGHMYSGRHEHNLCSREGLSRYTCSGCKEYGANVGFWCHECTDFTVHEACAKLPDETVHPLYGQDPFQFRRNTHLRHHCGACGEVLRGFVFESHSADMRLHPLCMALPLVLNYSGHKDHGLKLITEDDKKVRCKKCHKMISNWSYLCENTACNLSIDLSCAKVDFLKLSDHGIATIARRNRRKRFLEKVSNMGKVFVRGVEVVGAGIGLVGAGFGLADEMDLGDDDDEDDDDDGPDGDGTEAANDDDGDKAEH